MKIDDLTALDPSYPPKKYPKGYTTKASAKYYKRGQREYYEVRPDRVMRVKNKAYLSEVSITHTHDMALDFMMSAALEGAEITREEFAKEFEVASRLIVLEP